MDYFQGKCRAEECPTEAEWHKGKKMSRRAIKEIILDPPKSIGDDDLDDHPYSFVGTHDAPWPYYCITISRNGDEICVHEDDDKRTPLNHHGNVESIVEYYFTLTEIESALDTFFALIERPMKQRYKELKRKTGGFFILGRTK